MAPVSTTIVATETNLITRKSAQEVEIDHLLAEEFSCDPSFTGAFVACCGLPCREFQVSRAIAEPSFDGNGFGDLLVDGTAGDLKVALLIEDKISAGPAVRQAERYAGHANWLRHRGWDQVWTVLVAPNSYRAERAAYDASIDLEMVVSILRSPDPVRLAYRRGVIERALKKRASTGVQIADAAMRELRDAYFRYAISWCVSNDLSLNFPTLRESYYDGDSWIAPIRDLSFPANIMLRHRLWTSLKDSRGLVDLIFSRCTAEEETRLRERAPVGSLISTYSKGKGIQMSIAVPEMRQQTGFDASIATTSLQSMKDLVGWYLKHCA